MQWLKLKTSTTLEGKQVWAIWPHVGVQNRHNLIADVYGDERAALIVAAPDLLAACVRVRDGLDAGEHPGAFAAILDAAITKAEPQ